MHDKVGRKDGVEPSKPALSTSLPIKSRFHEMTSHTVCQSTLELCDFAKEVAGWALVHCVFDLILSKTVKDDNPARKRRLQKAIGYATAAITTGLMASTQLLSSHISLPSVSCAIGYMAWDSVLLFMIWTEGRKVPYQDVVHHITFMTTAAAGVLLHRTDFDRMMLFMNLAELNTTFLQTRIALRCQGFHIFHLIYQLNLVAAGITGVLARLAPHVFVSFELLGNAFASKWDAAVICSALVSVLVLVIDIDLLWRLYRAERIVVPSVQKEVKNSEVLEGRQWVARMPPGGFLDLSGPVTDSQAMLVAEAVLKNPRYCEASSDALSALDDKLVALGAGASHSLRHLRTPLSAHATLRLRYLFPVEYDLASMVEVLYGWAPMVGKTMLMSTGEVLDRTSVRQSTVNAALDMLADHPLSSPLSQSMLARINEIHGMYTIPNTGMMMNLGARIFCFLDVISAVGWRQLTDQEIEEWYEHWISVGKLMGIQGLDFASHVEFREWWAAELEKAFDSNVRLMARMDALGQASWKGLCAEWLASSMPSESLRLRAATCSIVCSCMPFSQVSKLLEHAPVSPQAISALRSVTAAQAQERTERPFAFAPSLKTATEDSFDAYGPAVQSAHLTSGARCPSGYQATGNATCPFSHKRPATALETAKQHNWPVTHSALVPEDASCGFLTPGQLKEAATSHRLALVTIHDKVYDVSRFAQFHPGGQAILKKYVGKDATEAFARARHSDDAVIIMNNFLVCNTGPHAKTGGRQRRLESIAPSLGVAPFLAEQRSAAEWEELLLAVARETLGADANIDPLTSLEAAGVSSLDMIRFVGALSRRTSMPVLEVLLAAPDLRSAARELASGEEKADTGLPSWVVRFPLASRPELPSLKETVVWCVHPAGGEVMCFRSLAASLACTQALGIRAPSEHAEDAVSIKERAANYNRVVLEESGDAAIVLVGYSFGGMVAVEMAAQLLKQRQQRVKVILVDTPGPFRPEEAADFSASLEQRAVAGALGDVMEQAADAGALAALGADLVARTAARGQSMALWQPDEAARDLDVTLLRCKEMHGGSLDGLRSGSGKPEYADRFIGLRDYGWGGAVRHVRVVDVGGDHMNVLQAATREVSQAVNSELASLTASAPLVGA